MYVCVVNNQRESRWGKKETGIAEDRSRMETHCSGFFCWWRINRKNVPQNQCVSLCRCMPIPFPKIIQPSLRCHLMNHEKWLLDTVPLRRYQHLGASFTGHLPVITLRTSSADTVLFFRGEDPIVSQKKLLIVRYIHQPFFLWCSLIGNRSCASEESRQTTPAPIAM